MGSYLYCQNTECGAYLGSLGGEACHLCGWSKGGGDARDCDGRGSENGDDSIQEGSEACR